MNLLKNLKRNMGITSGNALIKDINDLVDIHNG